MQRRIRAHGMTDDVRSVDTETVENRDRVFDSLFLSVAVVASRHIGGWISPGRISDAAKGAAQRRDLLRPGTVIACEFVNEENRLTRPGVIVIQRCAVGAGQGGQTHAPIAEDNQV